MYYQVGAKLVVLNLSQQTDSSDLLGGFRPVEARDALAPLLPVFSSLVSRTWTRGRNTEFLARVSKLAERRKWSQLLTTFRAALQKVWPSHCEWIRQRINKQSSTHFHFIAAWVTITFFEAEWGDGCHRRILSR